MGDTIPFPLLDDNVVTSAKIAASAVGTTDIANDAVTGAKLNPAFVAGDIIYADGTDTINRLAKGTAAQVLSMNAGATAPEWTAAAGGGLIYLATATASASASLNFVHGTGGVVIDATYGTYLFLIENLYHATNTQELRLKVSNDAGSSWEAANYYGGNIQWNDGGTQTTTKVANGAYLPLTDAQIVASNIRCSGLVYMHDPSTAATSDNFTWNLTMAGATGGTGHAHCNGGGGCNVTAEGATDGVQFYSQSGNLTSGSIRLYGVVDS